MNKTTLEALSYSGALDEFGNRKAIVDSLDELASFAKDYQQKQESGQMGLFGGADESAIEFTLKETVATKEDILAWERESLGLFVSDHPLKGLKDYFSKYGNLIGTLTEDEDADTSGKIEIAIFPQSYASMPRHGMEVDAFVRVKGKINERDGVLNCIANEIKVGDLKSVQAQQHTFTAEPKTAEVKKEANGPYKISIPDSSTRAQIDTLKALLREKTSTNEKAVSVRIQIQGKTIDLPLKVEATVELENQVAKILA